MSDVVRGRVDLSGKLIFADAMLLRLQEQAGGNLGNDIAVPALAGIVRLARTLGVLISRSVVCANGEHDLELIVRASPDKDGVKLAIGGWTPRARREPWLLPDDVSAAAPADSAISWTWETNAKLEILKTSDLIGPDAVGQNLTHVFRLIEDNFGTMPILEAAANGNNFTDQPAVMRAEPRQEVVLSGRPVRDQQGAFAGFEGSVTSANYSANHNVNALPLTDADAGAAFTEKLDAALRVPLSRIVASADSISAQIDGPLRRDYADYAGDIANAARHLLALVDDLSDLQTVDRADLRVESEEIDLAALARQAAGLLKVRAGDRKIRIDSPGTHDALAARGDYRRVLQILVNLIGNAIRYSPDGGMIWIRIEKDEDTAVLIVADQGKGIALDDHIRIFEKFERVDPSEPGGSGLGLFISRRLAQAMGGDIVVDSAPGQGARFVLALPAV
jgi:signal transduction histidine kinase